MRYREEAPLLLAFALAYIPDADSLVPSTPVHVPPTLSGSTRCGCGTGDPPTSGDFCWSSSGNDRQGRYNNRCGFPFAEAGYYVPLAEAESCISFQGWSILELLSYRFEGETNWLQVSSEATATPEAPACYRERIEDLGLGGIPYHLLFYIHAPPAGVRGSWLRC